MTFYRSCYLFLYRYKKPVELCLFRRMNPYHAIATLPHPNTLSHADGNGDDKTQAVGHLHSLCQIESTLEARKKSRINNI